jgi:hypothetical protein
MLIPTRKAAYPGSALEASLTAHNPSTVAVPHPDQPDTRSNPVTRLKAMPNCPSLVTNLRRGCPLTRGTYFVTFAQQSPRLGLPS